MLTIEQEKKRQLLIDYNIQLELHEVQAKALRNLINAAQNSCDHVYDTHGTPHCDVKVCRVCDHHEFIK